MLNEELRRDALVNSVSNADTLSETLERAHTTASETDDAGETILKSLSQQKHRLLSARAAAASMERDMESSERKLRRMGYEKCIQRWMWHVVALCVVAALGTFAYFKITADAHRKNGRHLSDYKIIDRDDETGKFVWDHAVVEKIEEEEEEQSRFFVRRNVLQRSLAFVCTIS